MKNGREHLLPEPAALGACLSGLGQAAAIVFAGVGNLGFSAEPIIYIVPTFRQKIPPAYMVQTFRQIDAPMRNGLCREDGVPHWEYLCDKVTGPAWPRE